MWWGTGFWMIVPAIWMAICVVLMVAMAFFCITRGCRCMESGERRRASATMKPAPPPQL